MKKQPLLIELVTEELPPKALAKLATAFASHIHDQLKRLQLLASDNYQQFATPRRLAVLFDSVLEQAPEQEFSEKLMPLKIGLDDNGQATAPLLKKLAAKGLSHLEVSDLHREADTKQEFLVAKGTTPGAYLKEQLENIIGYAIEHLPIPKVMRYQLADGQTSVRFVRPAHQLICLWGEQIIPVSVLGIQANRQTQGHRFMGESSFSLATATDYEQTLLEKGQVVASYEKRFEQIKQALQQKAEALNATLGDSPEVEELLHEVTALVEYPAIYTGEFEAKFLEVPQECLILTMRLNQKYFPLFDQQNQALKNQFLIVSNMAPADPSNIIEGNQRVIRPRLADAEFFFNTDKKIKLEDRVKSLENVIYHNKLGSQKERSLRVQKIAIYLAKQLNSDQDLASQAAYLAKADLSSNMVGEFPELQGVIGSYYAQAENLAKPVVEALAKQYQVRYTQEVDPQELTAIILFMAERLETLIGIWGIGLAPTGERDPYALRRAALGLISAFEQLKKAHCFETNQLDLLDILNTTASFYGQKLQKNTVQEVYQFILDRYRHQLETHYAYHAIDAVLAIHPPIYEIIDRINAVVEFTKLPEAESLAAANKRISNLLKKVEDQLPDLNPELFNEVAEEQLHEQLLTLEPKALNAYKLNDFTQSLKLMAQIRPAVDQFFNDVMVMVEDPNIKNNRLALLQKLHYSMNLVADLARLSV